LVHGKSNESLLSSNRLQKVGNPFSHSKWLRDGALVNDVNDLNASEANRCQCEKGHQFPQPEAKKASAQPTSIFGETDCGENGTRHDEKI
jgi:hypothetical protein